MTAERMHPEDLKLFAEMVIEGIRDLIADGPGQPAAERPERPALVNAAVLAEQLGVSRDLVYRRAGELGALRLGSGKKPRLLFDPEVARQALRPAAEPIAAAKSPGRRSRRRRPSGTVELLPIRGGEA